MRPNLQDINKAFENRVRIGVMSVLMVNETVDFVTLKGLLEVSDGNLASHTRLLEQMEYIKTEKQFVNRKPNTTFAITEIGRQMFINHINALSNLLTQQ